MESIFTARSIAVIGASTNPAKLGYAIVKNLLDYSFQGVIYPINLHEQDILSLRSYATLTEITDQIDIAVICIPATLVKDALKECVVKQVKTVIIISAGFKESGQDGALMEKELQEIIAHTHTRIIGPNCLGVICSRNGLNASFAANFPQKDPISFISQSGAMGTAFLDWSAENNLGIDTFISIGNKADIDENFLLTHIDNQKVIGCYLEDIKDGRRLMEIGYERNPKRPVVILKPGKSDAAISAIASHTGSLAGGHKAISTGLMQSGYTEVDTIGDMFHTMKAFAWQPLPKGNKVAIITNAGGPAVITTDLLAQKNLQLAQIDQSTHDLLAKALPRTANLHNPIDVIGDALADRYKVAMETVLQEPDVDALIVLLTPQIMTQIEQTAKIIGEMQKYNKPIIASFIGGTLVEKGTKLLSKEKIPAYHFPETAVNVIAHMATYMQFIKRTEAKAAYTSKQSAYYEASHTFVAQAYTHALKQGQTALSPDISEELLAMYNIPIPPSYSAATAQEAIYLIQTKLSWPAAMKISSPYLLHKSDIGGVITNLAIPADVMNAFEKLSAIIENKQIEDAHIEVQSFISDGQHVIIGANRDPNMGTILIFGQGGIYTEIYQDIARRIMPVSRDEINTMINETTIAKILRGTRGQHAFDMSDIVTTLEGLQAFMSDYSFISSVDINPLIVKENECLAIDIKILIEH